MSSRKRRQEEQMETAPIARPRAEKIEIGSIVTKRLSSHDAEDVAEAMSSLLILTNADENRKTAFRRGALLAVVQAIYRHGESATIHCTGLATLVNISCCQIDDYKPDIVEGGGLKCAIWSMGRHLGNSSIQENGCILIGTLFTRPTLRRDIADQGGLKSVVSAMKSLPQVASVQQWGCYALENLLIQESSWAKTVVDAGCITLVISAMNNHPDDDDVQMYGCDFLSCLSNAHDDYRNMVLDAEGLVPVVQALRIHKTMQKSSSKRGGHSPPLAPNCL